MPNVQTVRKYLGKDTSNTYRELLEKAADMEMSISIVDPFPLSNKKRIENLVNKLDDVVNSY